MNKHPKILLVEDEANFGSVLKNYLELSKYHVDLAEDGNVGLSKFKQNLYDLCLLDVMMPLKDGFTLAKEIRELDKEVPFIFLTAKSMKEDHIQGYEIGADDYITKPFDTDVLLHKIRVVLSRNSAAPEEQTTEYQLGTFNYDVKLRMLNHELHGRRLSPKEGALLELMCKHLNDVMPRKKALREIWKNDDYFAKRSMDVYITKLRKYLRPDPDLSIENIHGAGYRLLAPAPAN